MKRKFIKKSFWKKRIFFQTFVFKFNKVLKKNFYTKIYSNISNSFQNQGIWCCLTAKDNKDCELCIRFLKNSYLNVSDLFLKLIIKRMEQIKLLYSKTLFMAN